MAFWHPGKMWHKEMGPRIIGSGERRERLRKAFGISCLFHAYGNFYIYIDINAAMAAYRRLSEMLIWFSALH